MPIYEFKCTSCENEFEDLLNINDKNPTCSKCGSSTEKLISRTLGIVKGSTNRTIDCLVGEDSEKKWEAFRKRKQNRIINQGGK